MSTIKENLRKYIDELGINFYLLIESVDGDYRSKLEESLYNNFFEDVKDIKQKKKYKEIISEVIEEVIYTFQNSCKRYIPREQNLEIGVVESLRILIDNYNYEVNSNEVYKEFESLDVEVLTKDLAKRSLSNLKCLFIADYIYRSRKNTSYKVDWNKWFNDNRRYHIYNKELLKAITPLMVSHLKSNKGITTDDFFEIVEKIIAEFVSPIENSTYTYNVERKIYDNIERGNHATIIINSNNNIRNKTIYPHRIIINEDNSKSIEYSDIVKGIVDTSTIETISLDSIIDINDTKLTAVKYLESKYKIEIQSIKKEIDNSALLPFNVNTKLLQSNYREEEYQIILECDSTSLDYFLIKPLQQQNIYSTQSELLEFKEIYNYEINDNKFYVVATDSIINASFSVLKCLGEIKVITPTSLNDFVLKKIQKHNSLLSDS